MRRENRWEVEAAAIFGRCDTCGTRNRCAYEIEGRQFLRIVCATSNGRGRTVRSTAESRNRAENKGVRGVSVSFHGALLAGLGAREAVSACPIQPPVGPDQRALGNVCASGAERSTPVMRSTPAWAATGAVRRSRRPPSEAAIGKLNNLLGDSLGNAPTAARIFRARSAGMPILGGSRCLSAPRSALTSIAAIRVAERA